ncbi:unnamed protein product [Lupinus luteus]|uniref:Uncharacterized protein n=1 Tax=Lupinus luteus TaxID=3873 RepID=A0AAV1XEK6_LUPLU
MEDIPRMANIPTPCSHNQPNTHLTLPISLPITITVASSTTRIPITFTVNSSTISVAPIPRDTQYGLSLYASTTNSLGLLLHISTLSLPTIINIATDTMFVTSTVSANRAVHFYPVANPDRVPITQRSRPFEIFNLTSITETAAISMPIMVTINISVDTNTSIIMNVVIFNDAMVITSDTVTRIDGYIAILTMGSRRR